MLSDSSTFLKFWLTDRCREHLISALPKQDLANLRLVCHDFSARTAPTLFGDLHITFRPGVLTRPARLAALDRLGPHVKHLTFSIPHTAESSLPPLIHPETGEEVNFTYTPQTDISNKRQAKYGDEDITELLAHQYPPLFHAATNVPAFIRALSCFVHLKHLEICCPGSETSFVHQSRRSTVDFALISLRIAIERSYMNTLDTLTLSPIHPAGLFSLSPLSSCGATPASAKRWASIRHLSISTPTAPLSRSPHADQQKDASKHLTSYLSIFQPTLHTLDFTWLGAKGSLPFHKPTSPTTPQHHSPAHSQHQHQHHKPNHRYPRTDHRTLHFPLITTFSITNARTKASSLRALAIQHSPTLQTLELTNVELTSGTWEEAFAPLLKTKTKTQTHNNNTCNQTSPPRKRLARDGANPTAETPLEEMADIPIMFAPTTPQRKPCLNNPSPSSLRSRYPQHVHPSERFQPSSSSFYQSPTSVRERRVPRQAIPPPVAATLISVTTATATVTTTTVQKEKKSGGLFGRVARGVKRRFGG